ncbi:MAG: hypothetical protein F4X20_00085 [Dehalococcoidia bacterium]|nr:hypothetical protein [Dehalococcoidia bacterium]
MSLFDNISRNAGDDAFYSEESFEFLNRSSWKAAGEARRVLDQWFLRVPKEHRNDIRGRFQDDDREHSGALLELLTHEVLLRTCDDVEFSPQIGTLQPDFSVRTQSVHSIVECTVTQESSSQYSKNRMRRQVLDALDSLEIGPLKVFVSGIRIGTNLPPLEPMKEAVLREIEGRTSASSRHQFSKSAVPERTIHWHWKDWRVSLRVIRLDRERGGGAIGIWNQGMRHGTGTRLIARALERKTRKYKSIGLPHVVVVAQREGIANDLEVLSSLYGSGHWQVDYDSGAIQRESKPDGLFGTHRRPRKRSLSAVLFKRRLSSVWNVSNQFSNNSGDSKSTDWALFHNPFADFKFPQRVFPFAAEYVWEPDINRRAPVVTLNEFLGLPDEWPGEEH